MSETTSVEKTDVNEMDDEQAVARLGEAHDRVLAELRKIIVGQDQVIDILASSLYSTVSHTAGW